MKLKKKRRKIYYIDKIFQKKLLLSFLMINVAVVIVNLLYFFLHLKKMVEKHLYQSHINISNLNQIISKDVFKFNLFLVIMAVAIIIVYHLITRKRLKKFFLWMQEALLNRQSYLGDKITHPVKIKEKFHNINQVFNNFLVHIDKNTQNQVEKLGKLKKYN